jgi:methyl-accepting chemotaxis protein
MTNDDIELVQKSWAQVSPVKQVTAEIFCQRLGEIDPPLRHSFGEDVCETSRKFIQLIDATVRGLARKDLLGAAIRQIGLRHPRFGSSDTHHGSIAAALVWALEKVLPGEFTEAVKAAWLRTLGLLSQTIRLPAAAQAA